MNPKRLVIEVFDFYINQIDIHTEEQLEKYSDTDRITVSKELDDDRQYEQSKSMLVWNYLNATRDKMIEMLNEAQAEALRQLELVK